MHASLNERNEGNPNLVLLKDLTKVIDLGSVHLRKYNAYILKSSHSGLLKDSVPQEAAYGLAVRLLVNSTRAYIAHTPASACY